MNQEIFSEMVILDICAGTKLANRANILKYEEFAKTQPQLDIPVTDYIHAGMYTRQITIPKDTIITGQIYKFDHFDIMISGDITVSTDTDKPKRFTGFNVFKGMSGKKRAGYAHEDTTWITVHAVQGESGEKIQKYLTADTFDELREFYLCCDRFDYARMVKELGATQEEIMKVVENKDDQTGTISDNCYLDDSEISGVGCFSHNNIERGVVIAEARIGDKRTLEGRYINHSMRPNCKMVMHSGGISVLSIANIAKHEELTVNYRTVLSDRFLENDLCQA